MRRVGIIFYTHIMFKKPRFKILKNNMIKKSYLIAIIFLVICALSFVFLMKGVAKEDVLVKNEVVEVWQAFVEINNIKISVELADTDDTRRLGLSYRPELAKDAGMLFVLPSEEIGRFWMKDMNFSLDIIWISNGKIVNISKNLPPGGAQPKETYSSEFPVDTVLEVNGGFCDERGIMIGNGVISHLGF